MNAFRKKKPLEQLEARVIVCRILRDAYAPPKHDKMLYPELLKESLGSLLDVLNSKEPSTPQLPPLLKKYAERAQTALGIKKKISAKPHAESFKKSVQAKLNRLECKVKELRAYIRTADESIRPCPAAPAGSREHSARPDDGSETETADEFQEEESYVGQKRSRASSPAPPLNQPRSVDTNTPARKKSRASCSNPAPPGKQGGKTESRRKDFENLESASLLTAQRVSPANTAQNPHQRATFARYVRYVLQAAPSLRQRIIQTLAVKTWTESQKLDCIVRLFTQQQQQQAQSKKN